MKTKVKKGKGLLNTLINNLPVGLEIPGYEFCGGGTKLKEKLAKNIKPTNKLDAHCLEHDIFYANHPDVASRNKADMRLAEQAWEIVKSPSASFTEKAVAYMVTNAMKAKAKLGMGLNKKYVNYEQYPAVKGSVKRASLSRYPNAKRNIKKTKKTKKK